MKMAAPPLKMPKKTPKMKPTTSRQGSKVSAPSVGGAKPSMAKTAISSRPGRTRTKGKKFRPATSGIKGPRKAGPKYKKAGPKYKLEVISSSTPNKAGLV